MQDLQHIHVSPNNTFGLTEQVDHIVAECREDEYRVKTLLHTSAALTQQHQAKIQQGLPKSAPSQNPAVFPLMYAAVVLKLLCPGYMGIRGNL